MRCRNGFDPGDAASYTAEGRFVLVVQKGRELPRFIDGDLTLTPDSLWLISAPSMVTMGTTLRVVPGTQLRFGAPPSAAVYTDGDTGYGYLQVEGRLLAEGTATQPVEMFPLDSRGDMAVQVEQAAGGVVRLSHVRLRNPCLNYYAGLRREPNIEAVDHCHLDQAADWIRIKEDSNPRWGSVFPRVQVAAVTATKLRRLRSPHGYVQLGSGSYTGCAFDLSSLFVNVNGFPSTMERSVFLPAPDVSSWQRQFERFPVLRENAFLNSWWNPTMNAWLNFEAGVLPRNSVADVRSNYWATTSPVLIEAAIRDFNDDFNVGRIEWQPALEHAPESCYPFVVGVVLYDGSGQPTIILGPGAATFTVTFNRDMSTTVQPQVSFGPDAPVTDYTVHPVDGGWRDPRTWVGTFNITPITGDGYQLIRVAGAVAADDPWLVTGEDAGRYRFEIITSGTESMNLQATGGEGRVDLAWMQDDFELLAGYNLYRATAADGSYSRVNASLIPSHVKQFTDTAVVPGQPYSYRFTVVQTSMAESDFSNTAQATPLDTIPPVINHTPLTSATPGLPLTLFADVTDNVAVQEVTLFFRKTGEASYTARLTTKTSGNRYAATVEGSRLASPGLDYYVEASDGVSVVRSGRADLPWQVAVNDQPVVTAVSPVRGPGSGGTSITIAGTNFKAGAKVRLGDMPAEAVTVVSSSQLTCTTPPHYPAVVDVTVSDAGGGQSGSLLRGFTYTSDTVSLGLPHTGGGRNALVQIPVNGANFAGLVSAAVTVRFDAGVLRPTGAKTGSLTPGWSVAVNTNVAGQARVSMASPGGASAGSGVLAILEFEVLGAPGATSPLRLADLSLNDGAITAEASDGSFAVNVVYDISGRVTYWNQARPVPGVQLALVGDRVYAGESGGTGTYTVVGAEAGSYVLTPAKADGASGITAYDAALALEHDAGLNLLAGPAATAADVDKSGQVTALDAFYVLQRAVELIPLPFPGAGAVWEFTPSSRSLPGLSSHRTDQDFTGILLGDASGNWGTGGAVARAALHGPEDPKVVLSLRPEGPSANGVRHWLVARVPEPGLRSLEVTLRAGAGTYRISAVEAGGLVQGWLLAANTNEPGLARFALAGAVPVSGIGGVLVVAMPAGSDGWRIESAVANEGLVGVEVDATGAAFDGDTDGDGLTDWQEVLAGTDPGSKAEVLGLTNVELTGATTLKLSWRSVGGRGYRIETRSSLTAGAWLPVGAVVESTGVQSEATVALPGLPSEGYFRVRLE
jgi:hypothetical protein